MDSEFGGDSCNQPLVCGQPRENHSLSGLLPQPQLTLVKASQVQPLFLVKLGRCLRCEAGVGCRTLNNPLLPYAKHGFGFPRAETCTQDLGKALAVPVIVFNCSDGPALKRETPGPFVSEGAVWDLDASESEACSTPCSFGF